MLNRLWQRLGRANAAAAASGTQADWGDGEHILSQPRVIAAILTELDHCERSVRVHCADGRFLGAATLRTSASQGVVLWFTQAPPTAPPSGLNVVAWTAGGTILFSLKNCQPDAQGHLSAALPGDMIRMQSRDHYRLRGLQTRQNQVTLQLADSPQALPVHDLSEQGLGLRLDSPQLQAGQTYLNCTLHLHDLPLQVPQLKIVHSHPSPHNGWHMGAHMPNLPAAAGRALRRWLDQAQTHSPAGTPGL